MTYGPATRSLSALLDPVSAIFYTASQSLFVCGVDEWCEFLDDPLPIKELKIKQIQSHRLPKETEVTLRQLQLPSLFPRELVKLIGSDVVKLLRGHVSKPKASG